MGSNRSSKGSKKTSVVVIVLLVALCVPLVLVAGFLQSFGQMSAHEKSFFRAVGTDLRRGDLGLTTAKATANRNLRESKLRMNQSAKREAEADREYQKALEEQKRAVAAKRKPASND